MGPLAMYQVPWASPVIRINIPEIIRRELSLRGLSVMGKGEAHEAAHEVMRGLIKQTAVDVNWRTVILDENVVLFHQETGVSTIIASWPLSDLCPKALIVRELMEE
ncbi:MAG: hypothetical protein BWY99_02132 [Synergistetes bacterium ADurb.BinA166]|nr:MAG: hypothetical protein BWY99_02132 [Synergistetes bacterium ADurb.BinA166]